MTDRCLSRRFVTSSRRRSTSLRLLVVLSFAAVVFAAYPHATSVQAQPSTPPGSRGDDLITPATEKSIARGLAYLESRQNADGTLGTSQYRGNVAICGLAGMAFLASGSTPGRGPYGENIDRLLEHILDNTQPSGYIIDRDATLRGPMYGHGFALLFMAECYGMAKRPALREKIDAATRLVVNSQNGEGGWRYYPERADADISVTVCQVMALRAVRNCGVDVPKETIDSAVDYIQQCQNPDGGFMYRRSDPGGSEFPRSAAALVGLYSAGIYEGEAIDRGLGYLAQFRPKPDVFRKVNYYHYGHYYAMQAAWQARGDYWPEWYRAVRDEFLASQNDDGSWFSTITPEYGTAMSCIALQIPNDMLPIFQR